MRMQIIGPILHIGWRKVSMYPREFCWKLALNTLQSVLNHFSLLSLEDVDAADRRMLHAQKSSVTTC